jgi:hypothetical protein
MPVLQLLEQTRDLEVKVGGVQTWQFDVNGADEMGKVPVLKKKKKKNKQTNQVNSVEDLTACKG